MTRQITQKQLIAESIGWYGTLAVLSAYVLVTFNVIQSTGLIFQLLNLTGALGIIVIATYKKVKQTIVLNIFWGMIALIALINIFINR